MKNMLKLILLTIVLIPLQVRAAGIQVSPSALEFKLVGKNPASKEIVIANPTQDVLLYEIYADNFTEAITVSPKSFTLEAGGRRTAIVTAMPDALNNNAGTAAATNLSVIGRPLAKETMAVGAGVKIPLTITFVPGSPSYADNIKTIGYPMTAAGLVIILATVYVVARKKIKSW